MKRLSVYLLCICDKRKSLGGQDLLMLCQIATKIEKQTRKKNHVDLKCLFVEDLASITELADFRSNSFQILAKQFEAASVCPGACENNFSLFKALALIICWFLTLFYMGSGRYVNTWGGHFVPALQLSFKNAAKIPLGG